MIMMKEEDKVFSISTLQNMQLLQSVTYKFTYKPPKIIISRLSTADVSNV